MTSTFTPALRTEGLWSTTDSFINIPAPAAPSALSSTGMFLSLSLSLSLFFLLHFLLFIDELL